MKMGLPAKRFSAIGLDVGSRWVKAAQVSRSGEPSRLVACAAFPRIVPDTAPEADELRKIAAILRRQGFVGRDVVIPAPAEKVRSGILELPVKAAGVPMDQLARAEFARVQKMDVSAAELSWWELPTSSRAGKGTVAMAVAYAHADADTHVSAFEEAGLRVCAVDTVTSALARGCLHFVPGERSFGALDLGASGGALVLVRDGIVVYERRIPEAAIARLTTVLEEQLGAGREAAEFVIREVGLCSHASGNEERYAEARGLIARHVDAAMAEVRRTLAYAGHQYADAAVKTLLLSGGGAYIPGLCEYVGARVETDVRLAEFTQAIECDDELRRRVDVFPACAVGLARFP